MRGLTNIERGILTMQEDPSDHGTVLVYLFERQLCSWDRGPCPRCGQNHPHIVTTTIGQLALKLDAMARVS